MSVTREINLDTITPLVENPVSDSVVATDTVAAIEITDMPSYQDDMGAQANGNSNLIAWGAVGLAICVGVVAWRLCENLKKEVSSLKSYCIDSKEAYNNLQKKNDRLESTVQELVQTVARQRQNPQPRGPQANVPVSTGYTQPQMPPRVSKQVCYANLQSADVHGVLRFSERTMSEQFSPQKMFLLELDLSRGTGTYRVNPGAKELIISDLQVFRELVKPFNFSGDPTRANIQDKKLGRIIKQGNYWVVEEPLEISIN